MEKSGWKVTSSEASYQEQKQLEDKLDECRYLAYSTLDMSNQAKLELQKQEETI